MKKKLGDYSKTKDILEKEYRKVDIKDDPYFVAACLVDIKRVEKKWNVDRKDDKKETILDAGYKWLTLYPEDEQFAILTIFDEKEQFVEFYFDIAKKVNYKPRVPYIEDLYLDVVITKENDIIFVDEEELNEAYRLADIKQKDYELARKTADKIVNKFHNQEELEKLKQIAKHYLEKLLYPPID